MTSEVNRDALGHALAESGCDVRKDFPLGPLTTYAVGGRADIAVVVSDLQQCRHIAGVLSSHPEIPLAIIGRGSNTLIADDGFHGVAIVVNTASRDVPIEVANHVVTAPASMTMPVLARRAVAAGCGGLEWCVGIPGSVGGAVRMNAGGHGAEMVDSVVSAKVLSLRTAVERDIDVDELGLHFRGSALSGHHLVMSATFSTNEISPEDGQRQIDDIVRWRRDNQPGGRNAGSVFVNPAPGAGSAGALIDSVGLRGYRSGGACVSDKHANFIQAEQGARAIDVVNVMSHVQGVVEKSTGMKLRSEVCLLGFPDEIADRFSDPIHHDPERVSARKTLQDLLGESQ